MKIQTWQPNWCARANVVRTNGRGWAITVDGQNLNPGVMRVYFDPRRTDVSAADANTPTYSAGGLVASLHCNGVGQRFAALSLHDDCRRWRVSAAPGITQPLRVEITEDEWRDVQPPQGAATAAWTYSTGVYLANSNTKHEIQFELRYGTRPYYGGLIDALAPALLAQYRDRVPAPADMDLKTHVATVPFGADPQAAAAWEVALASATPLRRHNMAMLAACQVCETYYYDPTDGRLLNTRALVFGRGFQAYGYSPWDVLYPRVGVWSVGTHRFDEDTSPLYVGPEPTAAACAELAALAALPVLRRPRD